MKIENINTIIFNPILMANFILHFLSGAKNRKIKTELIYFVLPILFNNKIRYKLSMCKSSSSFKTLMTDDIKIEIIDLPKQAKDYFTLTNEALITLCGYQNMDLVISDFIKLSQNSTVNYKNEKDEILRHYYKSAFYLGLIFSKENYKSIFYKF
jgi:hypothetical protein